MGRRYGSGQRKESGVGEIVRIAVLALCCHMTAAVLVSFERQGAAAARPARA